MFVLTLVLSSTVFFYIYSRIELRIRFDGTNKRVWNNILISRYILFSCLNGFISISGNNLVISPHNLISNFTSSTNRLIMYFQLVCILFFLNQQCPIYPCNSLRYKIWFWLICRFNCIMFGLRKAKKITFCKT